MLTTDAWPSPPVESGSAVLSALAQGLPIRRTMEAVAAMAAALQPGSRCAVLLLTENRFTPIAEVDLRPGDRTLLEEIAETANLGELRSLGEAHGALVKPVLTQAAELVAIIIIFQFSAARAGDQALRQLDEICLIASFAIEQKNLTEELSYLVRHDPLTHLWNRTCLEEVIARTLDAAAATGRFTGLILIGIDSFRLFNELLGREAGDQVLRLVAARLADSLQPELSLARSGSDEFIILMPNLHSPVGTATFASQLRSWFDKPFMLGDHELIVRASFGTATAGPGECYASELQNRADQALLFAKRCARGRVSSFSADMVKTRPERLIMEKHLRFALQKREFELYYQPQVDLASGDLKGVEALLRWKHASLGFISPATFVPLAEEIGIIEEIGEWVLIEAVRQREAWRKDGLAQLRMAVNVSALQFARMDFASQVAKRLRHSRIEPHELELEITETALMTDFEHGARQIKLLRSLGVQIALDDFGTGHSSLAYLQQLPIDRLKIDRMFVKDITTSDERPALLSSIIQMGLSLGCAVIVEGVETVEQALALSAMSCEEAQGFLFAKPLAPVDLMKWIADRASRAVLHSGGKPASSGLEKLSAFTTDKQTSPARPATLAKK
jgi:diguanylate cyclase (GGDEF)-like protein